jgi:hypothetical protein
MSDPNSPEENQSPEPENFQDSDLQDYPNPLKNCCYIHRPHNIPEKFLPLQETFAGKVTGFLLLAAFLFVCVMWAFIPIIIIYITYRLIWPS